MTIISEINDLPSDSIDFPCIGTWKESHDLAGIIVIFTDFTVGTIVHIDKKLFKIDIIDYKIGYYSDFWPYNFHIFKGSITLANS